MTNTPRPIASLDELANLPLYTPILAVITSPTGALAPSEALAHRSADLVWWLTGSAKAFTTEELWDFARGNLTALPRP